VSGSVVDFDGGLEVCLGFDMESGLSCCLEG
jgi:hypothetical protein